MYEFFLRIVELVESWGYLGIFIMTFVESTFIPIPAEITLIPAGYLVHKGQMQGWIVLLISVLGTIGGSLFNYCLAYFFGRKLFIKYGKYLFMNKEKLHSIQNFFKKHGAISVFTGRLLPGIKHFISFPAGLAKMRLSVFMTYTTLGAVIWCSILIYLGYIIGENEFLIKKHLKQVNMIIVVLVSILIALYIWKKNSSISNKNSDSK